MVERPIKKSERQAAASEVVESPPETEPRTPEAHQNSVAPASEERSPTPRPFKNKEKDDKRGKGKGNRGREEQARPPANPALMRGPKPAKPKPSVAEEPQSEATEDVDAEVSQEVAADA